MLNFVLLIIALFFFFLLFQKEDLNSLPPYLSSTINLSHLYKSEKENSSESSFLFPSVAARHPANALADNIMPALYQAEIPTMQPKKNPRFKMFITGNLTALAPPPHVLRMCPPVTFRNWSMYRPLMAVGKFNRQFLLLLNFIFCQNQCLIYSICGIGKMAFHKNHYDMCQNVKTLNKRNKKTRL